MQNNCEPEHTVAVCSTTWIKALMTALCTDADEKMLQVLYMCTVHHVRHASRPPANLIMSTF